MGGVGRLVRVRDLEGTGGRFYRSSSRDEGWLVFLSFFYLNFLKALLVFFQRRSYGGVGGLWGVGGRRVGVNMLCSYKCLRLPTTGMII
jgi:hypothetical protein